MTGPETDLQFDKLYADSTVPSFSRRRQRSGLIAVALSILIHTCLVVLGFLASIRTAPGPGLGLLLLDTQTHGGPELNVVVAEAAPATAAKAVTVSPRPAPAQTPKPQKLSPPSLPAARRLIAAVPASPGLAREQEAPSHSEGNGFSGRSPGGPAGGSGKPSFFQIETEAQSVVYVIDCSASMGQNDGLSRAKAELAASLDHLPPATLFQIIPYNSRAEPLCINGRIDLVAASPGNKRAAGLLIDALYAVGGTNHVQALHRALALRADVIFFLTDADDLRPGEILALTRFNAGKTVIHAIGLKAVGQDLDPVTRPLQMLAQENRGLFRLIDTSR